MACVKVMISLCKSAQILNNEFTGYVCQIKNSSEFNAEARTGQTNSLA